VATLPPGPALPPLVQTVAALGSPDAFLGGCRRRYGDVFTLRIAGAPPFVVLCAPGAIREVFTGPADVLHAGAANAPLAPLVGERSVLLLDGAEHLRERRALLPPFHGERMRAYEGIIERATVREMEGWPRRRPFALLPAMQEVTLEVIMRAVLGVAAGARYEDLATRIRIALRPEAGRVRLVLSLLAPDTALEQRFAERVAAVDELVLAEIGDRRRDERLGEREDVLSLLLRGGERTDAELRDEVVTLLVAGHETTATALAWAFERLVRHPDVLERATEEARGGDGHAYLDAVVKEALRARPVIPSVGRILQAPYSVGGWELPAGTNVVPSIALTHRHPGVHEEPGAFCPERFLGSDTPSGYEWLPFGGGTRRCLGASFALFEMRVVLRTVLARARLAPAEDGDEGVVRQNVTLAPARGARVRLAA